MSRDQALQRVADDVELAQGVTLFAFVNLYGCRIGKDTKIGTFVEIQRGSSIGANCKIRAIPSFVKASRSRTGSSSVTGSRSSTTCPPSNDLGGDFAELGRLALYTDDSTFGGLDRIWSNNPCGGHDRGERHRGCRQRRDS